MTNNSSVMDGPDIVRIPNKTGVTSALVMFKGRAITDMAAAYSAFLKNTRGIVARATANAPLLTPKRSREAITATGLAKGDKHQKTRRDHCTGHDPGGNYTPSVATGKVDKTAANLENSQE
ncbi:hypothetical protein [Agrobacterium tumefaciens]|uniref:hypothetical protein n=1 Tax=Agrobacterium tumefaciens TaxID=358 RepID=UPI00224311FA|nr:hypothetical protein [Agrobacterium tumefaciens]MCW8061006.1 hypothetical protein [Agrobacterium tumefaciens]MCW8147281.1 hypothetical protein [Agrobacterium tumefaciens]